MTRIQVYVASRTQQNSGTKARSTPPETGTRAQYLRPDQTGHPATSRQRHAHRGRRIRQSTSRNTSPCSQTPPSFGRQADVSVAPGEASPRHIVQSSNSNRWPPGHNVTPATPNGWETTGVGERNHRRNDSPELRTVQRSIAGGVSCFRISLSVNIPVIPGSSMPLMLGMRVLSLYPSMRGAPVAGSASGERTAS